jgi:hypothetical protein
MRRHDTHSPHCLDSSSHITNIPNNLAMVRHLFRCQSHLHTSMSTKLVHETPTNSNAQINMATAMRKKQRPAMVTKEMLYPSLLCAVQKPYYCRGKIHTSAPSYYDGAAWPCTGALYPCICRRHRGTSALVSMMTWV